MRWKLTGRVAACATGLLMLLVFAQARAAGVPGQGTWETTLLGRDIAGFAVAPSSADAVFLYDTALNVTWLRDAHYGGVVASLQAPAWADGLVYGGFSDWRLPSSTPVNGSTKQHAFSNNGSTDYGTAKTGTGWGGANEVGHLFYVTLGNKGACTPNDAEPGTCVAQAGAGLTNTADFLNLTPEFYWSYTLPGGPSGTGIARNYLDAARGEQIDGGSGYAVYAMALRDGDVLAVPEPQTVALMLAGLSALALWRRLSRRA